MNEAELVHVKLDERRIPRLSLDLWGRVMHWRNVQVRTVLHRLHGRVACWWKPWISRSEVIKMIDEELRKSMNETI